MKQIFRSSEGREIAWVLLAALALGCQTSRSDVLIRHKVSERVSGSKSAAEAKREFTAAAVLRRKLIKADMQRAVRLYRSSAEGFVEAGMPQQAAAAETEAGNTLDMMSGYTQALSAYRRALALSGDAADTRCAALTRLAWTQANMGQSVDALHNADLAVAVCMPLKETDARAYARAVEAKGEAEFWAAHVENATTMLTLAHKLSTETGDAEGEALSAMLLAENVHPDDQGESHRLIASAMNLWTHSGNLYGAARGNLALAYFAAREGNYGVAECESKRALSVFERVADTDNAGVAFNVLGMVARLSGDLEAAADAYRRARKMFIASKDELGEGEAVSGLMDVFVDQNDTSNPELFARGLALARSTHNQALLATALAGTGDMRFRKHQYTLAGIEYRASLDAAREAKNPFEEALALDRLALVAQTKGNADEALTLYGQEQGLEERSGAIEDLAKTQYLKSSIYLAHRDPRKALTEIEKTIAIIETERLRISKFESRAQYFAWVHEYYALYIQALMALSQIEPNEGYAQRAFEASERSKARALLDELANVSKTVNCDGPQPEQVQTGVLAPAKDEEVQPDKSPNIETPMLRAEQIQTEMEDSETALVEFALGKERSFAWLMDGKSISAVALAGGGEIGKHVEKLRSALEPVESYGEMPEAFLKRREAQNRVVGKELQEIGQLLFGSMRLPASKRLIIVPDGILQYVPFAAVPMPTGVPLVRQYELAMLPSAATLIAIRTNTAGRPAPQDKVAVIADPIYERPGAAHDSNRDGKDALLPIEAARSAELTRALRDLHENATIANLPGSRREAMSIQKIFGPSHTRLLLGYEANRDAVLGGMLAQARVVHFATHGLLDVRQPENSGLVLALFNSQGKSRDGYLRVNDIHGLKLSAELVVLSSCDSALGKDMGSEGIIGLPRAFLYAGARRVIASLWKVDDEAAAMLMSSFYGELNAGKTPTEALSYAQRKLRQNPMFRDPHFWAAFFLEGEYR